MGKSGLYVPLDVNFSDDDKVMECSAEAHLLYIRSLLLSKRTQSDGFVHHRQLRRLTEGFRYLADCDVGPVLVAELVDVGLWDELEDGWLIAAFTAHNQTSEQLAEKKAKEAERRRNKRTSGMSETSARTDPTVESVRADKNGVRDSESKSESDNEVVVVASDDNDDDMLMAVARARSMRLHGTLRAQVWLTAVARSLDAYRVQVLAREGNDAAKIDVLLDGVVPVSLPVPKLTECDVCRWDTTIDYPHDRFHAEWLTGDDEHRPSHLSVIAGGSQ